MKEILRIIGKALMDIAGLLPDRVVPGTECVGCVTKVKPTETWKEDPPAQEAIEEIISRRSGDASCSGGTPPPTGLMNECVETAPLYTDMPCSTVSPPVQTAPPVQTDTPELDSEGIPWDKRIHSSGKTQYKQTVGDKKEGSWIHRKGVDPILLAQVKTELYQKYHPADTEPAAPPVQATQATLTNTDAVPTSQPFTQPQVQQGLPLPYGSITKWAPLMREAAGRGINHVAADGILTSAGLPTIAALQNNPSIIPVAAVALGLTAKPEQVTN